MAQEITTDQVVGRITAMLENLMGTEGAKRHLEGDWAVQVAADYVAIWAEVQSGAASCQYAPYPITGPIKDRPGPRCLAVATVLFMPWMWAGFGRHFLTLCTDHGATQFDHWDMEGDNSNAELYWLIDQQ